MVAQSDGNYVVTVPLSTFSERPIYFRVCAEDNCSNFGYSLAETDVRQPEFTTFTIIMSILIIIAGLIIGLWSIRRHYKGHVKEDSIRIKTVKKSLGFGGWISLGNAVWIFNWMMIKGFFGNPNITSIFPGSTVPNIGAAYSWFMNLQNSIIDFFTVDFFLGTLIINVCITLLWMIYHKQRLKIVDLIFGILGMFLFPLIGIIILPISFLVAGPPSAIIHRFLCSGLFIFMSEHGDFSSYLLVYYADFHWGLNYLCWDRISNLDLECSLA